MFNNDKFKYSIIEGIDHTFEEQGNQFGAVRRIQWGDSDKNYLEIRKWRNTPEGGEQAAKGYTFMTDDGPSELTKVLLDMGYCNTKEVLDIISQREDFRKSLNSCLGQDDEFYDESAGNLEDDFYNPHELIGG